MILKQLRVFSQVWTCRWYLKMIDLIIEYPNHKSGNMVNLKIYGFQQNRLVSNGGVAGTVWELDGCGEGHTLSKQPGGGGLSGKGALRAGSSINAPLRDNRGGGGGLSGKGALRAGSSINAPLRDNRGGGGGLVSKGCVE